jgi:hypothetical protein
MCAVFGSEGIQRNITGSWTITSLVQKSSTACIVVCVITETPKEALCSSWEPTGKWMNEPLHETAHKIERRWWMICIIKQNREAGRRKGEAGGKINVPLYLTITSWMYLGGGGSKASRLSLFFPGQILPRARRMGKWQTTQQRFWRADEDKRMLSLLGIEHQAFQRQLLNCSPTRNGNFFGRHVTRIV